MFFVFLIVNQIRLFLSVNVNYIDNDQVVMWSGAKHFFDGLFYVPRYYGQDYNTMMEALFAVPFMYLTIPVYYAVPIATHLIFLTPYMFLIFYFLRKRKKEQALFVLAILLAMPIGYDIINSIPRGFVTGLFFSSFLVLSIDNPKSHKHIFLNVFLTYMGYLVNPNSVLLSCPVLLYLLLLNYKNVKYLYCFGIAILLVVPIDYLSGHFYKTHPGYVIYGFSNHFSVDFFIDSISHINDRFAHISLFTEEQSAITCIILLLLGVYCFMKQKKWFISYLAFLFIIFLSFFSSKAQDGIVWPFFSYSRLYLGIPLFIIYTVYVLPIRFSSWFFGLLITVFVFSIYKQVHFNKAIAYHVDEKRWEHVNLTPLKEILQTLNIYKKFCEEQGAKNLLMVNPVWRDDIINYAGPAVYDDYPNTFKPSFERRSWRIEEEKKAIHNKLVIYTADYNFDKWILKKHPEIKIKRLDDWGCFLIYDNNLITVDFIKRIGAKTDGF